MAKATNNGKSLESWIWDAACSIRGAKDAAKFKDFIPPLIVVKRLCDVFDDELNCIEQEVGLRATLSGAIIDCAPNKRFLWRANGLIAP